jgi:hypothetical protein
LGRVFQAECALDIDDVGRRVGGELRLVVGRQLRPLLVDPFDLDAGSALDEARDPAFERRLEMHQVPGQEGDLLRRLRDSGCCQHGGGGEGCGGFEKLPALHVHPPVALR